MKIEFDILKKNEFKEAVAIASRAYEDYEYFTNYFPDAKECRKAVWNVLYWAWKTVFGKTNYVTAKIDGKMAAVAQLDNPNFTRPSVFKYLIHGWLCVYFGVSIRRMNAWVALDYAASKPCYDYKKSGDGIWYCCSLTVDPAYQGKGVGTALIEFMEQYARERGGKQLTLFTNSEKNLAFYKKRGFEVFDEREFVYEGHKLGSWSVKKTL